MYMQSDVNSSMGSSGDLTHCIISQLAFDDLRPSAQDYCELSPSTVGIIITGLILGLFPAIERRRYKVTPSLIGWAQT